MGSHSNLLSRALVVLALGVVACANRGMYSVGADGATGGAGGTPDGGGGGGKGGAGGGVGGAGGTVCVAASGVGGGSCNSTFNFENCALYGAAVDDRSGTAAFRSIANVRNPTSCVQGAMEISAVFGPLFLPDGAVNADIIDSVSIPFSGDLRNKVVTLQVMATPMTTSMTTFYFYPLTSKGAVESTNSLKTSPIPPSWITKSYTFPADTDGALGLANVTNLLIQARSTDSYVGKIYLDEVDIMAAPPDGGSTDGPGADAGSADAPRDAAAADAPADAPRDAAGN